VVSFEIGCWARIQTLTLASPAKAGEGKKEKRFERFPRPFRWERVRVRAISSPVGERKIMNHFVVKIL
jgi:hypothetical protein